MHYLGVQDLTTLAPGHAASVILYTQPVEKKKEYGNGVSTFKRFALHCFRAIPPAFCLTTT